MISKSIEQDMEEVKVMMMSCSKNPINESIITQEPIFPTWKLYDNPFYNHPKTHHSHHLHLPISARKIAAFTFFKPLMETQLDLARAQIVELQAELQYERKARKRGETMNKRLAKELSEEKRAREALERVCEELARGISFDKSEIIRLKREIEEERKMLRMAEVFREERVRMKLAEAKFFFEEKLSELMEGNKKEQEEEQEPEKKSAGADLSGKFNRLNIGESKSSSSSSNDNLSCVSVSAVSVQRRASPEAENHHIKRGIKGFVEFPRVVRAIGSKNRNWGTKLECQKAQLRILLRQKSPIRSNNLIIS